MRTVAAICLAVCGILLCGGSTRAAVVSCTVGATPLVFGAYDVFSPTPRDSTAVLSVICDEHSNLTIQLSRGSSPTFVPRTLLQGAATLNYNLFRDAAYSTIWGDGTGGTSDLTVRINRNHTSTFTVYGRLPAGQDASAGAYSDTIVVSVIY